MNDRELLEAAAKAAGLKSEFHHSEAGLYVRCPIEGGGYWNPLTDDGDALRLAAALALIVDPWSATACTVRHRPNKLGRAKELWTCGDKTPGVAIRRAIVCAAAIRAQP